MPKAPFVSRSKRRKPVGPYRDPDAKIKGMIREIVSHLDYDLAKSLDPETTEDPELAEEQMAKCVQIVKRHLPV